MNGQQQPPLTIRRMRRADIDNVLALTRKAGGGASQVSYRDLVASDVGGQLDMSFIAEADGVPVGFIMAKLAYLGVPFTEVCLIHGIVTDPDFRRSGVGNRLMTELVDHCHFEDIEVIRALVQERDADQQQFFERVGFAKSRYQLYDRTFES
jgi:ribosomal protein S18 acetylase RimI-like enzyme